MTIKSVDDLWKAFKVRHYGKGIGDISRTQIVESEMIFKLGVAATLVHLRDDVSYLPENRAVSVLEDYMKEIMTYLDRRCEEFK